jgi:hypothetical protein
MTTITFALKDKLYELEKQTGKRYGYADFESATDGRISRQTARHLLNLKELKRIDTSTLAALIDFFASEGMTITPNDLLRVE